MIYICVALIVGLIAGYSCGYQNGYNKCLDDDIDWSDPIDL